DNRFEMNAEAVREAKNFSGMEIRLDELVVQLSLGLVGREDVNPVGALGGFVGSDYNHAVRLGLLGALARRVEADDDLVATVAEVLGLGMPLAAVANDRDGFALQGVGPRIPFIKNSNRHLAPLVYCSLAPGERNPPGRFGEGFGLKFLGGPSGYRPVGRY